MPLKQCKVIKNCSQQRGIGGSWTPPVLSITLRGDYHTSCVKGGDTRGPPLSIRKHVDLLCFLCFLLLFKVTVLQNWSLAIRYVTMHFSDGHNLAIASLVWLHEVYALWSTLCFLQRNVNSRVCSMDVSPIPHCSVGTFAVCLLPDMISHCSN